MTIALLILVFSLIFINLILLYKGACQTNKSLDIYYKIIQKNLDLILNRQAQESIQVSTILCEIKCRLEDINKDLNYEIETAYRDLKADVLHISADVYRLQDDLKSQNPTQNQEEAPTDAPLMPPQKNPKRGRLRLEREVVPQVKYDPKTSDKPS